MRVCYAQNEGGDLFQVTPGVPDGPLADKLVQVCARGAVVRGHDRADPCEALCAVGEHICARAVFDPVERLCSGLHVSVSFEAA